MSLNRDLCSVSDSLLLTRENVNETFKQATVDVKKEAVLASQDLVPSKNHKSTLYRPLLVS